MIPPVSDLIQITLFQLTVLGMWWCLSSNFVFIWWQDDKADVILKYMPDEARLLKAYGELPENTRLNEGIAGGLDEEDEGAADDYLEFEDEDIDKI